MRKNYYLIASIIFIIIFLFIFIFLILKTKEKKEMSVCFRNNCFHVKVARTLKEQEKGLMYEKSLDSNEGMLFIFEREDFYPFWMKNTFIPLDIIWLNKNKKVVFISKNNKPCKENNCLKIFSPQKANYVLELKGGTADRIKLKIGEELTMKK